MKFTPLNIIGFSIFFAMSSGILSSGVLSSDVLRAEDAASGAKEKDIVIADFEGDTFGDWKVTGDAFGTGPAHDTLPNQHPVSGFQGKGYVNGYHNGDGSTGTLTSPDFRVERKYLNFLIGGGQQPELACINLWIDGNIVRTATGADDEKLEWGTWDVTEWIGKYVTIQIVDQATDGWGHINVDQIVMSDHPKKSAVDFVALYHEQYRPQFHFTAAKGWLNDPNGLVFYQGEYHLFFQHNPKGIKWGNMTWGHAVSANLLHWTQRDHAIFPDKLGTIFSGSAVVDWNNTAGFQTGDEKVIVCIYTSAGNTSPESKDQPFTQSIAYSNDRGRTWTKYDNNPVLKNVIGANRDPKVLWHAPSKQWIMALYIDKSDYALFASAEPQGLDETVRFVDSRGLRMSRLFRTADRRRRKKHEMGFLGGQQPLCLGHL